MGDAKIIVAIGAVCLLAGFLSGAALGRGLAAETIDSLEDSLARTRDSLERSREAVGRAGRKISGLEEGIRRAGESIERREGRLAELKRSEEESRAIIEDLEAGNQDIGAVIGTSRELNRRGRDILEGLIKELEDATVDR